MKALTLHYEVRTDLDGSLYYGIKLDWNCDEQYLDLSVAGYIKQHIVRYNTHIYKQISTI